MDRKLSKTLKIEDGKLLRNVDDVVEVEKIVDLLTKKQYIPDIVIDAKVFSRDEKLVQHEIIPYIIHSGEYTESMCYDVTKQSLDMAIDLLDEKLYGWDLLPHNFTFHKGKWFLYDFDSILMHPKRVKTLLRGFFKIIFPNYEILKFAKRDELKHYYLTRYKTSSIASTIPFVSFAIFYVHKIICSILCLLKQYKLSFLYLKKLFEVYTKKHKKDIYNYVSDECFEVINKICIDNNISNAFCVGEKAANWAIDNEYCGKIIDKFVYIDDYKMCDDYYNLIVSKSFKNIATAVLYPLIEDNEISKNISYRAIYDSYAKQRFYSDMVISLDVDITKDYIDNISLFSSKILVLSAKNVTEENLEHLKTIFKTVEVDSNFVVAKDKINSIIPVAKKDYEDGNRGPESKEHSKQVKLILHSKK